MQHTIQSRLKDFDDHLILKNFSSRTRKMYLRTLKYFLRYANKKFPNQVLSQDIARQYIIQRHKSGKSFSTINCDYSSLRKYFREVLFYEWSLKKMQRPRNEFRLPQTLSLEDITLLINSAATYKHQVFLAFVYITGLRLSEASNVTFEDIDRNRLQIRVRKGKGAKDRYIRIPEILIDILSDYYKKLRPQKYLFNGFKKGDRYCTSSCQWTMRQARKKAKLIMEIEWNEPLLYIMTEIFIFNARTEWRLFDKRSEYIGCYDDEINSELSKLIGEQIVSIRTQNDTLIDPLFQFSNGCEIEIFSSSNTLETWTMKFLDDNVFIVS